MAERKRRADTGSEHVVTSLRIDSALHERAKILAIREKTSLQALVNEALADLLKKRQA